MYVKYAWAFQRAEEDLLKAEQMRKELESENEGMKTDMNKLKSQLDDQAKEAKAAKQKYDQLSG